MLRRTFLLLLAAVALPAALLAAPAAAGTEDDEAIAADAVLTEDDVADYGLQEDEPSDDPPPSGAVCKKIRNAIKTADRTPHAVTAFEDGTGTSIESRVIVYENAKAARGPIKAYTGDRADRCIETQIEADIQENAEPGSDYEFTGGPVDVDLGDQSIVYQIAISITDPEGETTDLYSELGLIRVGRGLAVLQITSVGAPFQGSEDLATILVDKLTEGVAL